MAWIKAGKIYDPYIPPSWSDGTDAEIVEALQKHYNDEIDLTDYWSVGDERVVSMSTIASMTVGSSSWSSVAAGDVTFVILNVGGKLLSDGETECAFIVGQKISRPTGYIDSSTAAAWSNCARRTWCNENYYNAIPSTLRPAFKQHINKTGNYNGDQAISSIDYFALAAEKEVFGSNTNSKKEDDLTQFEYYKTTANRIKTYNSNSSAYNWWTRSIYYSKSAFFVAVNSSGNVSGADFTSYNYGIAPFGVI